MIVCTMCMCVTCVYAEGCYTTSVVIVQSSVGYLRTETVFWGQRR